jgi:hypothetical protein
MAFPFGDRGSHGSRRIGNGGAEGFVGLRGGLNHGSCGWARIGERERGAGIARWRRKDKRLAKNCGRVGAEIRSGTGSFEQEATETTEEKSSS